MRVPACCQLVCQHLIARWILMVVQICSYWVFIETSSIPANLMLPAASFRSQLNACLCLHAWFRRLAIWYTEKCKINTTGPITCVESSTPDAQSMSMALGLRKPPPVVQSASTCATPRSSSARHAAAQAPSSATAAPQPGRLSFKRSVVAVVT